MSEATPEGTSQTSCRWVRAFGGAREQKLFSDGLVFGTVFFGVAVIVADGPDLIGAFVASCLDDLQTRGDRKR